MEYSCPSQETRSSPTERCRLVATAPRTFSPWVLAAASCLFYAGFATVLYHAESPQTGLYTSTSTATSQLPAVRHFSGEQKTVTRRAVPTLPSGYDESSMTLLGAQTAGAAGAAPGMAMAPLLAVATMAALLGRLLWGARPHAPVALAATTSETVEYSSIAFPPLQNDRLLRTARGEPVDRIPVWIMRQAGRYLPEYREFMQDKEFFAVCRNPKQVAEITLQPILRYDLDASIIFSDILVVPQAMGLKVSLDPQKGPVFESPVASREAWHALQDSLLQGLGVAGADSMSSAEKTAALVQHAPQLVSPSLDYVYAAITETRMQLAGRVPLLGFCGAPMTLAIYMIEGSGSRTFSKCSALMHGDPTTAHEMLTVLAHMCAHYLLNQVKAGAQALQVFDSFAGALSPDIWREFSLPYMVLIADIIKKECPKLPVICFAKDAHYGLDALAASPYDIIALDSSVDLGACYQRMGAAGKGVQGNLDPTLLYAPPAKIKEVVSGELRKAFGDTVPSKYIANMGHGMSPDHDPVHLGAFIDAIHEFGQKK